MPKLFITIFCVLFAFQLNAQHVIATAGGDTNLESVNVSYTVGQLFFKSSTVDGVTISEGIHYPLLNIPTITAPQTFSSSSSLSFTLYPNPFSDQIFLKVDQFPVDKTLHYTIYNTRGQLLVKRAIQTLHTTIDMSSFASSLYLVRVFEENTLLKEMKILKK